MPPDIGFRPVTAADLPMLANWLARPHWRDWWGDPVEELSFIREMVEGRDSTRPYVFSVGGEDAGYIQVWFIADARIEPWLTQAPWVMALPDGAVGVDLSLADPARLGQGVGSAVLAAFVTELRAQGHREIWIDPDPANLRAVRAYARAGFREAPDLVGRTGDSLLMRYQGV